MNKDFTYKKVINNKIIWYNGTLYTKEHTIINPREDKLIEDGWIKHKIEPPVLYHGEDYRFQEVMLNQILTDCHELEGLINPVNNGIIYHYTTWEILFNGILNENNSDSMGSKCLVLRAYSVNYMNDGTEGLLLPNRLADREIEVVVNQYGQESLKNPLLKRRYNIQRLSAKQHKQKQFSISFSHENDSLPMWNYYGFNGKGLSLGFDVQAIGNQGYEIYDCIYDNDRIKKLAIILYNNIGKYPGFLNLIAKDSHFEYEKECRIAMNSIYPGNYIKTGRDIFYPIKYALKGGYIVPYVELYLPLSSMKEIVIGPTNNVARAEDSLKGWLTSIGMRNVKVKTSTAPMVQ